MLNPSITPSNPNNEEKARLMRRASLFTLVGVALLIALKLGAWYTTGSVSLLSSLMDSVMDGVASLMNFVAIRYALQPPDHEHRFGHGKAEYIAGLGQAAFISVTAVVITIEAIHRLFEPVEVHNGMAGVVVMVISIAVTLLMVSYQRKVMNKTSSTAVRADYLHYVTDVASNVTVILSLVLATHYGWLWADPVLAIGIALYILYGAWQVGNTAFQNLMDREFEDAEREAIKQVVLAHPKVRGIHELKTRRSGIASFIQFHIDLEAQMSFHDAHAVTEDVETGVQKLHPEAEVLVHADPV